MKYSQLTDQGPLSIIGAEARTVAEKFGAKWCEDAGRMLANLLVERMGGCQVYIPQKLNEDRKSRNLEIKRKFSGNNIGKLARAYGISERTVRRILQEHD